MNEWTDNPEVIVAAGLSHWPCTEGYPTSVGRGCSISGEDHEGTGQEVRAIESENPLPGRVPDAQEETI